MRVHNLVDNDKLLEVYISTSISNVNDSVNYFFDFYTTMEDESHLEPGIITKINSRN